MNNERKELCENIAEFIKQQYEYETIHTDAIDAYSVLLDNREYENRLHGMQFSDNQEDIKLLYYVVLDLAYLGQEEMEIDLDCVLNGAKLNDIDIEYLERCADCTVIVREHGAYAYMMYPDISVQAVIDLETDCMATETPMFNQELFQEILHDVSIRRGWCIDKLVSGKKKVKI